MGLLHLSVFAVCSALIGLLAGGRRRTGLLLALSVWAVFWLQPDSRIKYLDFWLPIATLGFTILSWVIVTPAEKLSWRENWKSALIIVSVVLFWVILPHIDIPESFDLSVQVTPVQALTGLGMIVLMAGLLSHSYRPVFLWVAFFTILALFVIIKTPALTVAASSFIRGMTGMSIDKASAFDIRWLGFSYIAFRIIHTFRDRQSGKMTFATLGEYVTYVIFFPALAAGPIDRLDRFVQDIRIPSPLSEADWFYAGQRIFVGMFKKFVLADSLALFALNGADAASLQPGLWTWAAAYAYSFQIFFDFSGYTDIAIGIARLVGVNLPENFKSPYLKSNLTQFWNNWHMTLTQWVREYFFNPMTRALRSSRKLPLPMIILITQVATMLLIGLWHGITLHFALWGIWHGIGLFIQNRWGDLTRDWFDTWASTPLRKSLLDLSGIFLTFNFVTVGGVFFCMPSASLARDVLLKLIGWMG